MARGFRVQAVEIQGFKGFASPKVVDFKGRHVFLLGQNGNGKSSIVEAVRWGLFGSAFRPNEVVKNQNYSGDCTVTLTLVRDGQLWKLRRRLNLGAGGSSDPVLTDQHNARRPIGDIMPQLDSIDAGEGTHVIFAAQSAPLRRQPEDFGPFDRTVLNHLGLTHPRALLSNINDFLEDQTVLETDLGEELTSARHNLDAQIVEEQTRRSHLLNAPSWGQGPPPSIQDSQHRLRRFIRDVSADAQTDDVEPSTLETLLERAQQTLDGARATGQGELEQQLKQLAEYRAHLEAFMDAQTQVGMQESTVRETKAELEAVYDGLTSDQLEGNLAQAKSEATTESLRGRIARDALELLNREAIHSDVCPVCDSEHDRSTLQSTLRDTSEQQGSALSSVIRSLESRVARSDSLERLLAEQEAQLRSLNEAAVAAADLLRDADKGELARPDHTGQLINDSLAKESQIRDQVEDQATWFESKQAQLDKLAEEDRFHRIQRRLTSLQADKNELERVIEAYNHLVAFGESVRAIGEGVESCLRGQLAQEIGTCQCE